MNTKSNQKTEFELILNGANWSEPEATLKFWVCPCSPSLKKCAGCNQRKKHAMSSSLRGGAWGGTWLNYCRECSFKRLEELKTSGFLKQKETELLSEIKQSIDKYNK